MSRLSSFVMWLAAAACQSNEPAPAEAPVIPEVPDPIDLAEGTDTFDSGLVAEDTKYARELRIVAFVGWNAVSQQITDIRIDNQLFISALEMQLSVRDGSSSADESDRCSVVVRMTGWPPAEPVDPGERFRLDVPSGLEGLDKLGIPGGTKQVFSECEERMFTGEQYPEGFTMENYWASLPWSFSLVEGPLDPDLEDRLVASDLDPELYAQGTQRGAFESGSFGHLTYWRAYEMDDFGNVAGTDGQIEARRLTRDEMLGGVVGIPPTAYYVFDQLVQWNLPDDIDILP